MNEVKISFGVERDKNNHIVYDIPIKLREVKFKAVTLFGGYTLVPHTGGWMNPDNEIVEEAGYTLVLYTDKLELIQPFADEVKRIFNQADVLVYGI